jgi:peptidyl-prolyl cis-trans isomerase C|tara:strand:- start:103 stop:456 length:354 start_codon:yes stop_codon:yes gene_type:complete
MIANVKTLTNPQYTLALIPHGENRMATASARHILVDSEEKCATLKQQIEAGADFANVASEHSSCPSGSRGGDLGQFGPGQMVKEFDDVVFSGELGQVHGPVKTQFGYHLLEITSREG